MSTITETSEVNSLASTPLLAYFKPSSSPSELQVTSHEPCLDNIADNIRDYIKELKGTITDMKKNIDVQNRYISDLAAKYEDSLDTIVELNTKVHQLEKEVQSWRVRAKSQELSSSMLEHDVNELRDTIVLLRRENIEIIEHTPLSLQTERKSDVKFPEQTTRSKHSRPRVERSDRSSSNDLSATRTMSNVDWKGLSSQANKKSVNTTPLLQKRTRKNQSCDVPNFNLEVRSIRQRPIDPSSPFDATSSGNTINSKRLPSLSLKHDLSKPSHHSFSQQFRKSTPRPSSLTEMNNNNMVYSRLELTSSKCIPSPRNTIVPLNQDISHSRVVKGNLSRRPYT